MRRTLIWLLASVMTFLAVSLAFLILANLATTGLPEISLIPAPSRQNPGPPLSLSLDETELPETFSAGEQEIPVTVSNDGEEEISDISVVAKLFSENTSSTSPKLYREEVALLQPGEDRRVIFEVEIPEAQSGPDYPDGPREIIQLHATGDGFSAFETVVIPVIGQRE